MSDSVRDLAELLAEALAVVHQKGSGERPAVVHTFGRSIVTVEFCGQELLVEVSQS